MHVDSLFSTESILSAYEFCAGVCAGGAGAGGQLDALHAALHRVGVPRESYRSSDECQSQCIHDGRYCTPDPDGDLQAGYSGKDIVQVGGPPEDI